MATSLKLYSYEINGTPLAYLDSHNHADLSGNTPFIVATGMTDSNYTDVTSDAINIIHKYGEMFTDDYQAKTKLIRLFHYEKGWTNLTHEEKDLVIDYYANPQINPTGDTQSMEVIMHLIISHGMTPDEATDKLVDTWHKYWSNVVETAPTRWKNAVKETVKFLSFVDSSDLLNTIENLVTYYLDSGRLGFGYGDTKDGILNYIKSDNGFAGTGLEYNVYTLKKGTWQELIDKLENTFVDKLVWDRITELTNGM